MPSPRNYIYSVCPELEGTSELVPRIGFGTDQGICWKIKCLSCGCKPQTEGQKCVFVRSQQP